jgi:hypothetical protein
MATFFLNFILEKAEENKSVYPGMNFFVRNKNLVCCIAMYEPELPEPDQSNFVKSKN